MRLLGIVAALLLGLLVAQPAAAQDINVLAGASNTIRLAPAPNLPGDFQFVGQTVTVPAGQFRIVGVQFATQTFNPGFVFRANIYAWDAVNQRATGPALFTSGNLSVSTGQTITVPTGNVPVTPGQVYIVFLQGTGGAGDGLLSLSNANPYPGGDLWFITPGNPTPSATGSTWSVIPPSGHDLNFAVDFEGAAIPTLSEWAMILMALLLAGAGAVWASRRSVAT